ncbi:protein kinase [uncultured Endozoicomonas sp.]|uniref:protein kinase domain-containing protein n=1 Tax=uncultured Endozoicomonas sp. TaxID=432652 RepID=UPI0026174D95|nr:protein kinase [uncultured Endozoicomonas sp.]
MTASVNRPGQGLVNMRIGVFDKKEIKEIKKAVDYKPDIKPKLIDQKKSLPSFAPRDAVIALWEALSNNGEELHRPAITDNEYLESELIRMLCSSNTLTVGDIKRALNGKGIPKDWREKFNKIPEIKYYIDHDNLRFYTKTLAKRFARALTDSIPVNANQLKDRKGTLPVIKITPKVAEIIPKGNINDTELLKANTKRLNKISGKSSAKGNKTTTNEAIKSLWKELYQKNKEIQEPKYTNDTPNSRVIRILLDGSRMDMKEFRKVLENLSTEYKWASSALKDRKLLRIMSYSGGPYEFSFIISDILSSYIDSSLGFGKKESKSHYVKNKKSIVGESESALNVNARKQRLNAKVPEPKLVNNVENKNKFHEKQSGLSVEEIRVSRKPKVQPELKSVLGYPGKDNNLLNVALNSDNELKLDDQGFKKNGLKVRKKLWNENREDKRKTGAPFTEVQAEDPATGKLIRAALLNTLPEDFFLKNGWSAEAVNKMPVGYRKNELSAVAKKTLNIQSARGQCRFLGKGSFGKVTPAWVYLPGSKEPTVCVAKKIQREGFDLSEALNEIKLQTGSGVAPKVYGVSETTTQKGKRQFIIFMEPAKGSDGLEYIKAEKTKMRSGDKYELAESFSKLIIEMHENDTFHCDIKLENSSIESKSRVKLLDFGCATKGKHKRAAAYFTGAPKYMAPEMIAKGPFVRSVTDMEKVDVFSLGVLFGEIFGNGYYMSKDGGAWDCYSRALKFADDTINTQVKKMKISDKGMLGLVRDMMHKNPDKRPTMQAVMSRLKQLKNGQTLARQDSGYNSVDSNVEDSVLFFREKKRVPSHNAINYALNGGWSHNWRQDRWEPFQRIPTHGDISDVKDRFNQGLNLHRNQSHWNQFQSRPFTGWGREDRNRDWWSF